MPSLRRLFALLACAAAISPTSAEPFFNPFARPTSTAAAPAAPTTTAAGIADALAPSPSLAPSLAPSPPPAALDGSSSLPAPPPATQSQPLPPPASTTQAPPASTSAPPASASSAATQSADRSSSTATASPSPTQTADQNESAPSNSPGGLSSTAIIIICTISGIVVAAGIGAFVYNKCIRREKDDDLLNASYPPFHRSTIQRPQMENNATTAAQQQFASYPTVSRSGGIGIIHEQDGHMNGKLQNDHANMYGPYHPPVNHYDDYSMRMQSPHPPPPSVGSMPLGPMPLQPPFSQPMPPLQPQYYPPPPPSTISMHNQPYMQQHQQPPPPPRNLPF